MKRTKKYIALLLIVLTAISLLSPCAQAEGRFTGEAIPTVEKDMRGYHYTTAQQLLDDLRSAGSPASVDIRPAHVPARDLIAVCEALPGTMIFCTTELLGKEADTSSTELDLSGTPADDIALFQATLACFPRLSRLVMCDCEGADNALMEELARTFPYIRFVWRVYFGKWSLRTDAQAFSTLNSNDSKRYDSKEFSVLRYCTDLRALDLGHNAITDIGFLEPMTNLKILILADNQISDISPLAKLKKLEYIELFMNNIVDFSPLSGLDRLLDLNLCHNKAVDASPLQSLTQLERLWLSYNRDMPKSETKALQEALPNTLCNFTIFYSTHGNWRHHPRYAVVKYIFDHGTYLEWDADVPSYEEQTSGRRN